MTHDSDQEHPGHDPHSGAGVDADWEVFSGPAGPEREPGALAATLERWQRQPARARTVTTVAAVAVLALGGGVAYATTSGEPSGGTTPAAAASDSAPPSPDDSDDSRDRPRGGPWFGLGGGVHGESTVQDPDSDEWVVRAWQRGTVEKVDGDQVTVKSEDGTEWTWTVDEDTRVRSMDRTSDSGADDLKEDDTVYLTGIRSDGDLTADYAVSGTLEDKDSDSRDRRDWRGGFPGPWGGEKEDRTPSADS
ncbi:hypothetical protein ACFYO0_22270 [Streptomyces sp. NPDC006365]|uniref:hypothetical protein n=1 Tax=Streptomyces sp. NPDC006365 TaxID=3364744 RepID=UPI0036B47EB1